MGVEAPDGTAGLPVVPDGVPVTGLVLIPGVDDPEGDAMLALGAISPLLGAFPPPPPPIKAVENPLP